MLKPVFLTVRLFSLKGFNVLFSVVEEKNAQQAATVYIFLIWQDNTIIVWIICMLEQKLSMFLKIETLWHSMDKRSHVMVFSSSPVGMCHNMVTQVVVYIFYLCFFYIYFFLSCHFICSNTSYCWVLGSVTFYCPFLSTTWPHSSHINEWRTILVIMQSID